MPYIKLTPVETAPNIIKTDTNGIIHEDPTPFLTNNNMGTDSFKIPSL